MEEAIDGLTAYKTEIDTAKDKRDLLTIESRTCYLYFRNYAKLFDRKYGLVSRNGGGIRTGNRYASDPINGFSTMVILYLPARFANLLMVSALTPTMGFSMLCTVLFKPSFTTS